MPRRTMDADAMDELRNLYAGQHYDLEPHSVGFPQDGFTHIVRYEEGTLYKVVVVHEEYEDED
jgi:hypothetical protein